MDFCGWYESTVTSPVSASIAAILPWNFYDQVSLSKPVSVGNSITTSPVLKFDTTVRLSLAEEATKFESLGHHETERMPAVWMSLKVATGYAVFLKSQMLNIESSSFATTNYRGISGFQIICIRLAYGGVCSLASSP